jgi:hypothetical protein
MRSVKGRLFGFEVEGEGNFPTDMLRYDRCWPESTEDASKFFPNGERRVVRLIGFNQPNIARWASFLWRVKSSRILR